MPTLVSKSSNHEKEKNASTQRQKKLSDHARANILFQAHLTTTARNAPEGFSPKVIRTAALCSPRHFMDERASIQSVTHAIRNATITGKKGQKTSRHDVRDVKITKKKKSMLATVKMRAPTVEVLTRKKEKKKELQQRALDYDRKYETSKQREKKDFTAWLNRLGDEPNPGQVPVDSVRRKVLRDSAKDSTTMTARAVIKHELAELFNYFLLAGAGQQEYENVMLRRHTGNTQNDGFMATSPLSKPGVKLRNGKTAKEHFLNCHRMFLILKQVNLSVSTLKKAHRFAKHHGIDCINLVAFEEWWRFGCLSTACQLSPTQKTLQYDLSAKNKVTRVWWRSQKFMINAISKAPSIEGAMPRPRTRSEYANATAKQKADRALRDLELRDSPRLRGPGASGGIAANITENEQNKKGAISLALPAFLRTVPTLKLKTTHSKVWDGDSSVQASSRIAMKQKPITSMTKPKIKHKHKSKPQKHVGKHNKSTSRIYWTINREKATPNNDSSSSHLERKSKKTQKGNGKMEKSKLLANITDMPQGEITPPFEPANQVGFNRTHQRIQLLRRSNSEDNVLSPASLARRLKQSNLTHSKRSLVLKNLQKDPARFSVPFEISHETSDQRESSLNGDFGEMNIRSSHQKKREHKNHAVNLTRKGSKNHGKPRIKFKTTNKTKARSNRSSPPKKHSSSASLKDLPRLIHQ